MRDKFSSTGRIPVTELQLDQHNYRLGSLENQADCISIMLQEMGDKIEALAKDISSRGLSPEPIVVSKDDTNRWVVRDGNRRITALKLLNNPALAPDGFRLRFQKIVDDTKTIENIISEVECLTSNEDLIIEYMALVHSGAQDGVGQVKWDSVAKDNFQEAIGGDIQSSEARIILKFLKEKGAQETDKASVTNIQRLFQDKSVQDRLGISISNGVIIFNLNEDETIEVLKEIALDFSIRGYKVKSIYKREDRETYIQDLFTKRGLKEPSASDIKQEAPSSPQTQITSPTTSTGTTQTTNTRIPVAAKPPRLRKRVISAGLGLRVPESEAKTLSIIDELARRIDVREAPIAAGVLVRLLIESSVDFYSKTHSISHKSDKLKDKICKLAEAMKDSGHISEKQREQLIKMKSSEELLSAHTLNAWVHNLTYMPTPENVCIFWDNTYFFLATCWAK